MKSKAKDRAYFAIAFIITAVFATAVVAFWQFSCQGNLRDRYSSLAENRVNVMHENITRIISTTSTLEALIINEDGDTSFFEDEAPVIYQQAVAATGVHLRNIAIAPNGVVSNVYPLESNESLIGFDFFDESKPGNESAIRARDAGTPIMTNPFTLTQGGTAVSTRQAVSLSSDRGIASRLSVTTEQDGESRLWGLVTATMDFDDLVSVLDFESLDTADADYCMWYEDDNGEKAVIASSETLPNDPESQTLSALGVEWHLDVAPHGGWIDWQATAVAEALALLVSALISMLCLEHRRTLRANETLRRLANLDSLTSCYSRHYVNTILINQHTGDWNDPDAKYSLVIVDIDRFKTINDTYGHDVGDKAIVAIARVLMDNCRAEDGDCVIRHGGDEFVIVFNDVTLKRFRDKLQTIAQQVRDLRIEGEPDLRLTVSLGAEYYSDPETSRYYDMLNRSDAKLYEAKEAGRDLIVL